jgi:hypothetical protein
MAAGKVRVVSAERGRVRRSAAKSELLWALSALYDPPTLQSALITLSP